MLETARAAGSSVAPHPSMPTYLKARDLMEMIGVRSRSTLARMIAQGVVPPPMQLGPRSRLWDVEAVKARLDKLALKPSNPDGNPST